MEHRRTQPAPSAGHLTEGPPHTRAGPYAGPEPALPPQLPALLFLGTFKNDHLGLSLHNPSDLPAGAFSRCLLLPVTWGGGAAFPGSLPPISGVVSNTWETSSCEGIETAPPSGHLVFPAPQCGSPAAEGAPPQQVIGVRAAEIRAHVLGCRQPPHRSARAEAVLTETLPLHGEEGAACGRQATPAKAPAGVCRKVSRSVAASGPPPTSPLRGVRTPQPHPCRQPAASGEGLGAC